MAQRKLSRFNLDESVLRRLSDRKILTPRDLLSKTEIELMQVLDLDRHSVKRMLKTVSQGVAPSPTYFVSSLPFL